MVPPRLVLKDERRHDWRERDERRWSMLFFSQLRATESVLIGIQPTIHFDQVRCSNAASRFVEDIIILEKLMKMKISKVVENKNRRES